jgi:PAS domain S-box-containing protein
MLATCSRDDLLRMIQTIGVPTFAMDVLDDGTFQYAGLNVRLEEISGFSISQVRGKSPADILVPARAALMEQRCRNCVRLRGPLEYEEELDLRGTRRWLRVVLVPLFDPAGRIVRLMGTVNDITDQKSAEQELLRTRELYRGVLDEQHELISRFLPDTTLTYVNVAYARAMGRPAHELIGRRFAHSLPDLDRDRVLALFQEPRSPTGLDPISFFNENALISGSGELRWIRWHNVALTDGGGKIVGYQSVGTDITDQHRAEEGLRTARQSLREAIDSISEGFALYDSDDRLVLYNGNFVTDTPQLAAFETPLGVTFEQILRAGVASRQIVNAGARHDPERWIADRLRAHRHPPETPVELRLANGRHISVAERRTRDGSIVCIQTDITRLREQEAKIRESERRLKVILDTAADAILTIDKKGLIRDFNKAAERIFGYPAADMIGRSVELLMPRKMAADHQSFIDMHILTGVNRVIGIGREVLGKRADGSFVDLDLAISAVSGSEVLFTGILRDITDRKQAERALRDSEQRFRLLADNATDIISLHAPDTTILYISPSSMSQLGHVPTDLAGRRLIDFVHPDDRGILDRKRFEVLEGHPRLAKFRLRHRDGRWLWFESMAARIDGATGAATGGAAGESTGEDAGGASILVSSREITERVRYEQDLREASDRLAAQAAELRTLAVDLDAARRVAEQASLGKSQFLAMMSHELRTPMTGVLGMVDLLRGTPLSEEQRGYVSILGSSAKTLLTLLNDILDFSKIEAGQLQIEEIDFDLRRVIGEVVQLFLVRADEKGIGLTSSIPDDVPAILRGDPTRLRQVLFNLVSNAIKFTQEGSVELRLAEFDASPDGEQHLFRFEVIDTGLGLKDEELTRLFEPFVQADATTTRRFGGTGLGLAICRQLVQAMGGSIGVRSEWGSGSVFHFTVRLGRARIDALPPPSDWGPADQGVSDREAPDWAAPDWRISDWATPEESAAGTATHGVRILLAEDNEVNRMLVLKMLERMGHVAEAVVNGREAVEAASNGGYDLILMDMQMPVMDGASATREIRRLPGMAGRVPIVALTADAISNHRERHLQAGLDAYFTKPIDWNTLAEAIIRLTGSKIVPEDDHQGDHPDPMEPELTLETEQDGDLLIQLPLLDTVRLEELRAAVGDSYELMIGMFPDSAREELDALRGALDAADAVTARRAAHTLKGVAASFGATRVQAIAHMLEDTTLSPARSKALITSLESALDATLAALG